MPIPFLEAGGPVNGYAIEDRDGGLLLFDSGLGSPQATAAMMEGLAAHRPLAPRRHAHHRLPRPHRPLRRRGGLARAGRPSRPGARPPARHPQDGRGVPALVGPGRPLRGLLRAAGRSARGDGGRLAPGEGRVHQGPPRPPGRAARPRRAAADEARHLRADAHARAHARAPLPVRAGAPALPLRRPPPRARLAEPAHRARARRAGGLAAAGRLPRVGGTAARARRGHRPARPRHPASATTAR